MKTFGTASWLGLAAMLWMVDVGAAGEDGAQRALAKAQFTLRQVNAEKLALEQKVAELQKQLDTMSREISGVKQASATTSAKQEKQISQLAGDKDRLLVDSEKLRAQLKTARSEQAGQRESIAELQAKLGDQEQNFARCYINNKKLYQVNQELLGKYEEKGPMDALVQREPFTGLSQVKVENLVQDYQYRLDDLKLPMVDVEVEANGVDSGG